MNFDDIMELVYELEYEEDKISEEIRLLNDIEDQGKQNQFADLVDHKGFKTLDDFLDYLESDQGKAEIIREINL